MSRTRRRTAAALTVLLAAGGTVAAMPATGASPGARSVPPVFRVGAAVVRINPRVTTYSGGFGASPPIRPGHVVGNPLSVRAMYVSNGSRAVELAVVDAQAEFAAYQEGPHFGLSAARAAAAAAVDRHVGGPTLSAGDIVIQSTHSHSAPTLEGLWGPVPRRYLRAVTRAETRALVVAARRARPARLSFGRADGRSLDDVAVAQYDAFPGWSDDPLLSVLRASDARTGATIATYAAVPAHPDIVCGACSHLETADYMGIVRADLHRQLGGVSLVGPATLGREETPVQATNLTADRVFARDVLSLVDHAVASARPVAQPTIAAAQRSIRIAGTGAALLGLVEANHLPPAQRRQIEASTGEYPIDRADTPPWQTGTVVGTVVTALRIGSIVYASMPGEPFPEIRQTLAKDARDVTVVALSKGQDDLGYFYPSYVTPLTEVYPSDTLVNSASAETGDDVVTGQLANFRALGVRVTSSPVPQRSTVHGSQQAKPGLQIVGGPLATDAGRGRVRMIATFSPPDLPEGTLQYGLPVGAGTPAADAPTGPVRWTFGDGRRGSSGYHEFAGTDRAPVVESHRFTPGRHRVTATVRFHGSPVRAHVVVRVFPQLHVGLRGARRGARLLLRPVVRGGDGRVVAVRWRAPGCHARRIGRALLVPRRLADRVRVRVTDGTGASAWSAVQR